VGKLNSKQASKSAKKRNPSMPRSILASRILLPKMLSCVSLVLLPLAVVGHGGYGADLGMLTTYDDAIYGSMPPPITGSAESLDESLDDELVIVDESGISETPIDESGDTLTTEESSEDVFVPGHYYLSDVHDSYHQQGKFDTAASCKRLM
jgi:hypothetical protein